MRPSLYNNEFVINDLLRAAHPGGGTTVISVDSPSGGEGRVEDLIERQLITIDRMVRRQTVASKIAELSNTLDEMGEIKLSFKAAKLMKIAEDVTGLLEKCGKNLLRYLKKSLKISWWESKRLEVMMRYHLETRACAG